MRFQVPQFIEVEDKIFGPLTFKQFIYIAGAIGVCVVLFTLLPKFLALLLSAPILAFGAALSFYKVNDRPFVQVAEDFFKYTTKSKLYIWQKENKTPTAGSPAEKKPPQQVYVPTVSQSKLKDLAWSLDITEHPNGQAPLSEEDKV